MRAVRLISWARCRLVGRRAHFGLVLVFGAAIVAAPIAKARAQPVAQTAGQAPPGAQSGQAFRLQSTRSLGDCDRVEGLLEVGGEVEEVVDEKPQRLGMSVVCRFGYHERTFHLPDGDDPAWRTLRHYDTLETVIKVGDDGVKPELRPERRLIGVEIAGSRVTLFAPKGPLTADELELVDILANSLLLDRLLPKEAVAVGQSWEVDKGLLAAMLGLDELGSGRVQSVLSEVTETVARFEMSGSVQGTVEGVKTQIELKARYRFDRRRGRIDWIGLLVREKRGPGHVSRGIDAVARLQMTVVPTAPPPVLGDEAVQEVALRPTPELLVLGYQAPDAQWQLTHDRDWHVLAEQGSLVILRLVRGGQLIAQCNISPVSTQPGNKQLTLADFQEDVRQALGKNFGQLVSARQYANAAGYRVYGVVAEGEVSEIPIRWHYYLVTEEQGRQVAFAFTVEKSLAEGLSPGDQQMVDSLRFAPPQPASAASEPRAEPSARY